MKNKQICQPIKFGKFTSNWFWGVLYQPVHPESNINHFHQISLLDSALWFFIKTRRGVRKINFKIIFAPSLGSYTMSRPSLVNLYLTWGVLCQSVHLEWNVSHFRWCFLCGSAVWFFIKTRLPFRNSNFKIIFAPPLGFLAVSRPSLVNRYLTDFGAFSANQCTQNQI